jgi:hypothetical protein
MIRPNDTLFFYFVVSLMRSCSRFRYGSKLIRRSWGISRLFVAGEEIFLLHFLLRKVNYRLSWFYKAVCIGYR